MVKQIERMVPAELLVLAVPGAWWVQVQLVGYAVSLVVHLFGGDHVLLTVSR